MAPARTADRRLMAPTSTDAGGNGVPDSQPQRLDARTKLIAAWVGVAFTVIAILGFLALPGARLVWIVLLIFGVATIPQVLLAGRINDSRDRDTEGPA